MTYLIWFLVVLALAVMGSGKVTMQGAASRKVIRNSSDSVIFTALLFLVIAGVQAILFPLGRMDTVGVLMAAFCGLINILFQTCYAIGLGTGPVSITSMIVNFAGIFTSLYSIIAYREDVYLLQIFGVALLIGSLILSVKRGKNDPPIRLSWVLVTFSAMVCGIISSSLLRAFGKGEHVIEEGSEVTFNVILYAVAAALGLLFYLIRSRIPHGERTTFHKGNLKFVLLFALAIGVDLGIYQRIYTWGSINIDGGFMYPTFIGLSSLIMTGVGLIGFRDRLSTAQKIGIVCGLLCVVLMNLRIGPCFSW